METQALYYPYIKVPAEGWFTRVLLYWDTVGTISPQSLGENALGEYTSTLMRAGLVRQVWPEQYIFRIPRFAENFFAIVDADEATVASRGRPLTAGHAARIHGEKFTDEIFWGLRDRGLGQHSSDAKWWDVEPRTASIYMAYLAATLGGLPDVHMDPVSDTDDLFVPAPESPVARAEALRFSMLEAILPGPELTVPTNELADFKEKHADSLRRFRNAIEHELLRIALIADDGARVREKALTEDRLRQEIEELVAAMKQRRWPRIVFGSIAGLASVAAGAVGAVLTGGTAIALAAPGVVNGAYAALDGLPRRRESNSPVAFAALAAKAFAD